MSKISIIGIAGGSGSGKTTFAIKLASLIPGSVIISCDDYYKPLPHLSEEEKAKVNFDSPNAIDIPRLKKDLESLKSGKETVIPQYDFATHDRKEETKTIIPVSTIIVEGILVLAIPEIRTLFDLSFFVDCDDETRFSRRLKRDLCDRSRTIDSITLQYNETVRPMYEKYILPSKKYADYVIEGNR